MSLDPRSLDKLQGVHPALANVVKGAAERTKFRVTEGLRDRKRQAELVRAGKSKTMNSRHLTGMAIDFIAIGEDGVATYDLEDMKSVAGVIKGVATEQGIKIAWGGDWDGAWDTPHIELDRKAYPQRSSRPRAAWAEEPMRDRLKREAKRVDLRVGGGALRAGRHGFHPQGRSPRGRRSPRAWGPRCRGEGVDLRVGGGAEGKQASTDGDERTSVQILKRALQEPARRIAENSAVDGGVVVARMLEGSGNLGFDASRNQYVDLWRPASSTRPRLSASPRKRGLGGERASAHRSNDDRFARTQAREFHRAGYGNVIDQEMVSRGSNAGNERAA